jgi:GNAT superfamily N-acetyltransferase
LTDCFSNNTVLNWCSRGTPTNDFLFTFFKSIINSTTLSSRDFVVQVEGCKGAMIWTNHTQGLSFPTAAKLARMIGWTAALRCLMQYQPWRDKWRRKVMASYDRDHYITIAYLGVLPHEHRKGYGSALLKYVSDKADTAHYPIYVEVTEINAIPFFERHGFAIKAQGLVCNNSDMPVVLMVRDPVPTADSPTPLRLKPGRSDSDNLI